MKNIKTDKVKRLEKIIEDANDLPFISEYGEKEPHPKDGHKGYKRLYKQELLERFKKIFGDEYDYVRVRYKGRSVPIDVICKYHGLFLITPHSHYNKVGCKKCKTEKIGYYHKSNKSVRLPSNK